jgi:hypothetical protein
MMKIDCRFRIGSGPGVPGFSGGYGISAMDTANTPRHWPAKRGIEFSIAAVAPVGMNGHE